MGCKFSFFQKIIIFPSNNLLEKNLLYENLYMKLLLLILTVLIVNNKTIAKLFFIQYQNATYDSIYAYNITNFDEFIKLYAIY